MSCVILSELRPYLSAFSMMDYTHMRSETTLSCLPNRSGPPLRFGHLNARKY